VDYCASVLFVLPDSRIKELQKIQNKFLRNILKVNKYTSVKIMLDALKFQSVNQRLVYNNLRFMYKIDHGLAPEYLEKMLRKNKIRYDYNLRRKSLFELPNFRKQITQSSLFYKTLV
jgi:predicted RNA-binding protein with PIN domain